MAIVAVGQMVVIRQHTQRDRSRGCLNNAVEKRDALFPGFE